MDCMDMSYVNDCNRKNKRFYMHDTNKFESLTLDEYNQRFETTHMSWGEVDDISIFSADEMLYHYNEEDIKFL